MDRQITETPRELDDHELELVAGGWNSCGAPPPPPSCHPSNPCGGGGIGLSLDIDVALAICL
jgi:hypothetical protein